MEFREEVAEAPRSIFRNKEGQTFVYVEVNMLKNPFSKRVIIGIVATIISLSLIGAIVFMNLLARPPGIPQNPLAIGDIWDVTIQWSEVEGAESYNIYWSTTPGLTKTSGTKIEVTDSSYSHKNLANNVTYYYLITAVGPGGESGVSTEISAITRLPKITGTPTFPDLSITYANNLPGGGLYGVFLYDLSFNALANDTDTDPSFSFPVKANENYILIAYYYGGQSIAAVTPTVTHDLTQNISIDTEVTMNLIVATEQAMDNLEPTSLSRPLDDLLADANQEVIRLNAFYQDRNNNRTADRIADAVHALTLDKLSQGAGVSFEDLNEATIRAYGGGLQGIRSLSDILNDPKPPLNPHFTFSRYNSNNEVDFGMSDLDTKRWDYLQTYAFVPHITTGGTALVFYGLAAGNVTEHVMAVYKTTLGAQEAGIQLTPANIDCDYGSSPYWSPDESKIAFSARYANPDPTVKEPNNLFVMNADGSGLKQLTHYTGPLTVHVDDQGARAPSWSPDGSKIIFESLIVTEDPVEEAHASLEIIDSDGGNQRTFLDGGSTGYWMPGYPSWSPAGDRILFHAIPPGQDDFEIVIAYAGDVLEEGDVMDLYILTANTAMDQDPSWSHDGRFVIFSSNREEETGTLPGVVDLMPFYVVNSYNAKVVADLGNFADAGYYLCPRFTAIEAVFVAVEGANTDEYGNAIIDPGSDTRTGNTHSSYNYYREIIPAANTLGITFACTSWFG